MRARFSRQSNILPEVKNTEKFIKNTTNTMMTSSKAACTGQRNRKSRPEKAGGKDHKQGIGGIGVWDNSTLRKQTLSAVTGGKQGLIRWRQ